MLSHNIFLWSFKYGLKILVMVELLRSGHFMNLTIPLLDFPGWRLFSNFFFFENDVLFLNLYLYILNWRILALQCCVGFCHISTWFSHRQKNVPSLLSLSFLSHSVHPTRKSQSTGFEFPMSYSKFPLAILHMFFLIEQKSASRLSSHCQESCYLDWPSQGLEVSFHLLVTIFLIFDEN